MLLSLLYIYLQPAKTFKHLQTKKLIKVNQIKGEYKFTLRIL